ncbi:MAG TPA: hypothetical protein VKU89_03495 [Solirubrobacteraceae bacterium]|nr:hypothetical protein [Solirubrobacteraceae bacterium]
MAQQPSSEIQPEDVSNGGQPDPQPVAPEDESQQSEGAGGQLGGQPQPWGEWTPDVESRSEAHADRRLRSGLIAGGALAGGGALALIASRRRAHTRRSAPRQALLVPERLRRIGRRRPSQLELLGSRLWHR